MMQPGFQIIAAGICPAGLDAGARAPNVVGATALSQGVGEWLLTVDDPTIEEGNAVLILSPGSAADPLGGVNFGQDQQQGGVFAFKVYQTSGDDAGTPVDVPVHFIIVKGITQEPS